jgi:phosphopantetheinyl transferase
MNQEQGEQGMSDKFVLRITAEVYERNTLNTIDRFDMTSEGSPAPLWLAAEGLAKAVGVGIADSLSNLVTQEYQGKEDEEGDDAV